MDFIVGLSSPADREKLVADIVVDGQQLAEINQERERLTLELYARRDGEARKLDYEKAIAALLEAKARLVGND